MERKQDGLVPIGEVFSGLDGPGKALRKASPQALHHFTRADQVDQLVGASEADADLGFMARLMALCSLPRTNPGNQHQYKRQSGADPNPRDRSRPLSFRVHANASYCQKLGMDASGGAVPTYRYTDFFRSCSKS